MAARGEGAAEDGAVEDGADEDEDFFDKMPCDKCQPPQHNRVLHAVDHHCHICDCAGTSWTVDNVGDYTSLDYRQLGKRGRIAWVHRYCEGVWDLKCTLDTHKGVVKSVVGIGVKGLMDVSVLNTLKERLASYYGVGLTIHIRQDMIHGDLFYPKVFWLGDGAAIKISNKR